MMMPTILIVAAILLVSASLYVVSRYFVLWLQALFTGTRIRLVDLILMSLRKVHPQTIVQCRIMGVQAGIADVSIKALEAQYLAGGDVLRTTLALIAAQRAGIPLDWNTAAAIDLAGRDILDAVKVSVNPRVIDCPDNSKGGRPTLDGVARDGIQLKVRVRVTGKTNVAQLVGGATEATIIARVGEGIVSAIGSCETYLQALADPLLITRQVVLKGLDAESAFSIISIDIADITVGKNIGSQLQIDQAEADIRIAVAAAETRRAAAVARHQEMIALTRENEAEVELAQAQIPQEMATAYRNGNLHPRGSSDKGTRTIQLRMARQFQMPLFRLS